MKKLKLNKKERPWVKYYNKDRIKPNLTYSNTSMTGYLLEAVSRFPEYIAYEYYGKTCTYTELYEKRISNLLQIYDKSARHRALFPSFIAKSYSTVTLLARFRGLSISQPRCSAT